MSELSPQEHVDSRVLAYYGAEFDEDGRLVDRSGQGVLEGLGAQAIEISRSQDPLLIAAAQTLAEAYESQHGLRDLSPHLLAMGRTPPR